MYKARTYRNWVKASDLVSFEVIEKETDLYISAAKLLEPQARESILNYRAELEGYIKRNPAFFTSLSPLNTEEGSSAALGVETSPEIARSMIRASSKAGVGPMAAVAGAMAEFVGRDLLKITDQVIVENGGDIFLKTDKKRTLGIYAGDKSPFTGKLALEIEPRKSGLGVCTSSGTTSHSLSFGSSDAALVVSEDTALADAVATGVGNILKSVNDIEKGIQFARSIEGVIGVLVILGDRMGSWGEIKLV